MGFILFESFGEKDTAIVEEIAKLHKAPVSLVDKFYKEMLQKLENEIKK